MAAAFAESGWEVVLIVAAATTVGVVLVAYDVRVGIDAPSLKPLEVPCV